MMDYAGDRLKHLHIADVFDHTANVGNRYIMNPPGVDARIHQHNEIGNGEIDWDDAFAYLREREYDGDRKSTRLNSSHVAISYAVFCLKKKKNTAHLTQISEKTHAR